MKPDDIDEERLIRIERILEQLQKDSSTLEDVAAKAIENAGKAAPTPVARPRPAPARKT